MMAKKKYRVECGAFVTVFRSRVFTVSANSEEEAEEKAKDRFYNVGRVSGWDVDSVEIDDVEEIEKP